MDLSLTETQRLLQQTARDFLDREAPRATIVALQQTAIGAPPALWQTAAALGWLGMLIPEAYGGAAASLTDTAVLFEELGKGPLPGPFFSSGVLAALVVREGGTEEQRQRLLPAIAEGRAIVSVALTEPHRSWGPAGIQLRAARDGGDYVLSGVKQFVGDAVAASHLLVAVRAGDGPEEIDLLLVDRSSSGVTARNLPGFLDWQAEVTLDNVRVPAADLIGGAPGAGWAILTRALQQATPVLCAYAVGGCQAVFDMSVAYSQTRHQFGVPIGRFQRVQDHIIAIVNHLDAARWTTYEALWKLDTDQPGAAAGVHLAKAVTAEAYLEACNYAHEVHAGIGSAIEYGLVPFTRMSRTLYHTLGDPLWHKRRMTDALGW